MQRTIHRVTHRLHKMPHSLLPVSTMMFWIVLYDNSKRDNYLGSAIYVYGILSHSTINPISGADIMFFIDDEFAGSFSNVPDGQKTYTYNFLLYANNSLPHSLYVLHLQNGQAGGPLSLVLLDYFIYSSSVCDPASIFFCIN